MTMAGMSEELHEVRTHIHTQYYLISVSIVCVMDVQRALFMAPYPARIVMATNASIARLPSFQ